jgi:hypothetical protein
MCSYFFVPYTLNWTVENFPKKCLAGKHLSLCDGRLYNSGEHTKNRKWEFQKRMKKMYHSVLKKRGRREVVCSVLVGGQAESECMREQHEIVSWPTWERDSVWHQQYSPHSCQILWHLSVKILLSVIFIFGRTKRAGDGERFSRRWRRVRLAPET